jgi:hypothetical protein
MTDPANMAKQIDYLRSHYVMLPYYFGSQKMSGFDVGC